jgi:hypothetical protein
VDGTDGDMLWNVRGQCEEDKGTDCEDGDSESDWLRLRDCFTFTLR